MRLFVQILLSLFIVHCSLFISKAQLLTPKTPTFSHADTLRGSLNPNRTWWEVKRYDIDVTPDYNTKSIQGKTTIHFFDSGGSTMQIDLQKPLVVDSIVGDSHSGYPNGKIPFARKEGDNFFLLTYRNPLVSTKLEPGMRQLTVYYHGTPRQAINPPWDGGWIWAKDAQGRPWMSVACQGLGASVWYPCKDYQGDEPDSGASLIIHVPDTLMAVGNGRLKNQPAKDGKATYTWEVKAPINNYTIIPYIGKYVRFGETYSGEKGPLTCDYWVLDYNVAKAKEQFKEVPRMLKAFEFWFGPYPFYQDGYKLVDAPHLGMEHQSAVAYGNRYQNGYLGRDLSGSGEGLKFDFIIVHESGHEWFANNITSKDIADMWIHESFTNYSETLFLDYWYGNATGDRYVQGLQSKIRNDAPIIGPYGVNTEGSGDMYNKGGCMLHTIRQCINNDTLFRSILRGLNQTFYHQTVTTRQVEEYITQKSGIDLSKVFNQYLRTTQIPQLQWRISGGKLQVSFTNCVAGFAMPVKLPASPGKYQMALVGTKPVELKTSLTPATIDTAWDKNYYIEYKHLIH